MKKNLNSSATSITQKIRLASCNLAVTVCVGAGVSTAHAANLIQNGSFEAPVEPGTGIYSATPAEWTGGAFIFQGTIAGWPAPEVGIQFDDMGNGGSPALTQVVDIPLAGSYTLTWFDNEAIGDSHFYDVLLNGNIVANPSGVGSATWTPESLVLNLSSGDNTLAFKGLGGLDTLIDNVDLRATTAVPDAASTFFMLNIAVFGVAALRRRSA